MTIYEALESIKEVLINTNLFKSVKIGLEKGAEKAINMPLCRIILEEEIIKGAVSDFTIQILVVFDTKNDYELLYKEFLNSLEEIKLAIYQAPLRIEMLNTFFDEDRFVSFKAGILRVKIKDLGLQ